MTAMIWQLAESHVLLPCDTLATGGDDRRPLSMTTKVFVAGHLSMIIGGTGLGPLAARSYLRVVESMIVRDVIHLAEFGPDMLLNLQSEIREGMEDAQGTSTVYTFGWSAEEGDVSLDLPNHARADHPAGRRILAAQPVSLGDRHPALCRVSSFVHIQLAG